MNILGYAFEIQVFDANVAERRNTVFEIGSRMWGALTYNGMHVATFDCCALARQRMTAHGMHGAHIAEQLPSKMVKQGIPVAFRCSASCRRTKTRCVAMSSAGSVVSLPVRSEQRVSQSDCVFAFLCLCFVFEASDESREKGHALYESSTCAHS